MGLAFERELHFRIGAGKEISNGRFAGNDLSRDENFRF